MSLDGNYDADNIFAKILRGDMPAVKVYEDEDVLAFMDVFPVSPGHVLVIPKAPSRNILDTKPEVLQNLITHVQRLAGAVDAGLTPDGIRIMQFSGAPAGQTVYHLHFHIIPHYTGKKMQGGHGSGEMADMSELEKTAARIRAAL